MKFYDKEGLIFLVQLDHLSGELLGDAVDSFYKVGAKNIVTPTAFTHPAPNRIKRFNGFIPLKIERIPFFFNDVHCSDIITPF